MLIDLHSRTVIITGAGSGIGAAAAQLCVDAGATVIGIDIDFTTETKACQSGKMLQIRADVRQPGAIVEALDVAGLQNADGLILSAAASPLSNPTAIVQTNYVAAVSNGLDALRVLRKSGSMVAISSTAAYRRSWPSKWNAIAEEPFAGPRVGELWDEIGCMAPGEAYRLAKWALNLVAPRLFSCCASYGIRLNYVVPGPTESPMSVALRRSSPEAWDSLVAESPFGVANSARDVGSVIAFLMSDFTRNLHGSFLHIDGGWYASLGTRSE